MSYPRKLSHETILEVALGVLEREGSQALSMRAVAAELKVAPNALYRYFPGKAELVAALAEAGSVILLDALRQASAGQPPLLALRSLARAYLDFARSRPALYQVKMAEVHCTGSDSPSHDAIWSFVLDLTASLPLAHDPHDIGMAMWASLHGLVELDRLNLLEGRDPGHTLDVMLDLTVAGLMAGLAAGQPPTGAQP